VKVLLDACVLFPGVMRAMLLGAVNAGGFTPLWSARILEEWARATRRLPPGAEAEARAAIAAMRAAWPAAEVPAHPDLEAMLSLPDPSDRHVLAAAITGGAAVLLTLDRDGFPTCTLARHGILRVSPDALLCDLVAGGLDLRPVAAAFAARSAETGAAPHPIRSRLRRAGLPRLGKALGDSAACGATGSGRAVTRPRSRRIVPRD